MAKTSQAYDERKIEDEDHEFIVFFLNDDEDQSVHVEEVEEVDFLEVIQHLSLGGSVFITHRRKPKQNILLGRDFEDLKEPWYFNRI